MDCVINVDGFTYCWFTDEDEFEICRYYLRRDGVDFKIFWRVRQQCLQEFHEAVRILTSYVESGGETEGVHQAKDYWSDTAKGTFQWPSLAEESFRLEDYVGFIKMTNEIYERCEGLIDSVEYDLRDDPESFVGVLFLGED